MAINFVSRAKHKPNAFFDIFTPHESVFSVDDRSDIFSISQGTLSWQPILCCTGLFRSEPKYLRIRWTDFHSLCTYGRYCIVDVQSDLLFPIT